MDDNKRLRSPTESRDLRIQTESLVGPGENGLRIRRGESIRSSSGEEMRARWVRPSLTVNQSKKVDEIKYLGLIVH